MCAAHLSLGPGADASCGKASGAEGFLTGRGLSWP